jgi:hypothetical protein
MDPIQAPSLISPATLDSLRRTRGWTLFMAILFILGAVAMVGIGLVNIIMGLAMGAMGTMGTGDDFGLGAAGAMTGINVASGVVNLIIGLIYIVPIIFLFRFIGAIPPAVGTGDPAAFIAAMDAQRKIWKTFGILVIVYIGLMLLMIVGFALFGLATFPSISESL